MENLDTDESVVKTTNSEGYAVFEVIPGNTYRLSEILGENWQHNYIHAAQYDFPKNYGEIKNPEENFLLDGKSMYSL